MKSSFEVQQGPWSFAFQSASVRSSCKAHPERSPWPPTFQSALTSPLFWNGPQRKPSSPTSRMASASSPMPVAQALAFLSASASSFVVVYLQQGPWLPIFRGASVSLPFCLQRKTWSSTSLWTAAASSPSQVFSKRIPFVFGVPRRDTF